MNNQLEQARLWRCRHDWPVYHLKHLARLTGGGTPAKENGAFWEGGDVPWISPKDMKHRVITSAEDYITEDAVDGSATSFVDAGSPLMVVRSGILRHTLPVAIAGRRLTLNQDMKAFNLSSRLNPMFFVYWVEGQGSDLLLEWRQFGATVESIDTGRLLNGRLALPDLPTQKAIADFLDRETARIDQLIEKKQRMVEVLGEKLAVLLEQLTTPDSPKDANLIPFRWVCRVTEGQVDPTDPDWAHAPLIAPNHIQSNTGRILTLETAEDQGAISGKYAYSAGTVLYSKIRPALAKACIAPQAGLCSADMYPILTDYRLFPEFLLMQLLSRRFTDWATLESMRVAMPKINRETLGDYRFWVPCQKIQARLIGQFTTSRMKVEQTTDAVTASVDRLREFRSALITAAVTGQIDVSTWGKQGTADRRLDEIEEATSV